MFFFHEICSKDLEAMAVQVQVKSLTFNSYKGTY